jgi:hypothetical protein
MPRQMLLLCPEDVLNGPPPSLAGPAYAEITDDSEPDRVQVRLLPLGALTGTPRREHAGTCLWVHRSRANQRRIWEGELTARAPGSLLRRPVFAMIDDRPYYGHVTAYDGATVTIRHGADEVEAPVADVEAVAPIIVFLLSKAKLVRRISSRAAIDQPHTTILDHLLGSSTRSGTREIRRLLTGTATLATHPSPTAELPWMDPRTGQNGTCRVRHVVDFGFYTDDNQVIPTGTILGSQFWIDPHAAERATGPSRQPLQEAVPATTSQDPQVSQDERLAVSSVPPMPTPTRAMAPTDHARFVDFMDALEAPAFVDNSRPETPRQVPPRSAGGDNAPPCTYRSSAKYGERIDAHPCCARR